MLIGMTERGPDSAGLAVYASTPSAALKFSLFQLHGEPDWGAFLRGLTQALPRRTWPCMTAARMQC